MQQITVSLTLWPQMGGRMLRNMGCLHTAGRASWNLPALLPLHSRSARRFVGSAPTGCLPLYLPPCLKSCCAEAVGLLRSSFNYSLLLQSLEELKQQPLAWLPCIHVLSVCLAGWLVHAGM